MYVPCVTSIDTVHISPSTTLALASFWCLRCVGSIKIYLCR